MLLKIFEIVKHNFIGLTGRDKGDLLIGFLLVSL